jgi:protein polybromo-1
MPFLYIDTNYRRTPNFFSEVTSPSGISSAPITSKGRDKNGEKANSSRYVSQQISPLQIKMNEVFDRICDLQSSDGRKLSTMFQKLPSKAEYPDYYNIIRKPMDLSRIRQKLDNNQYETQRTFFTDLKLCFENACKFNEPDSQIYKDALTFQQEIMEICAEDAEEDKSVPSVQSQVRRILTNLLVSVNTYTERGRCLSNSFTEVVDMFRKNGIPTDEMPFTLDQIKMNLDKGRYKRLDRFQEDVFALFSRVRALTRPESQLFLDSIDLQKFFISKREELCKGVLVSPASSFTESDLWDEIDARKKAFKREKSPAENVESTEAESDQSKVEMEEPEKPKESEEILESVEFNGVTYKPKEYAYVGPSEDSVSREAQNHIFRIESIVRDSDNKEVILLKGVWVFRPSETYHLSTRKFYEKVRLSFQ